MYLFTTEQHHCRLVLCILKSTTEAAIRKSFSSGQNYQFSTHRDKNSNCYTRVFGIVFSMVLMTTFVDVFFIQVVLSLPPSRLALVAFHPVNFALFGWPNVRSCNNSLIIIIYLLFYNSLFRKRLSIEEKTNHGRLRLCCVNNFGTLLSNKSLIFFTEN